MKKILLGTLLCMMAGVAPAQYWVQSCGGPTFDEGTDADGDRLNHYYATGYFTSASSFGSFNVASAGVEDIYLLKGDTSGLIQWVVTAGGSGSDKALSIDADSIGGTVITGSFYGTAIFGSQSVVSHGQQDVFVARYDSAGTLLWVQSGGGTGSDAGNSVTFDRFGNVYVTGEFSGSCNFGPYTLVSAGGSIDVFIVKYSPAGSVLWARQGSGNLTDRGTDVTTDAAGSVYVGGQFSDTITFDVPHPNTILNAMFLVKYNPAGQERWFRWMGSGGTSGIAGTESVSGGIHMAGSFTGTLFFFDGTTSVSLPGTQANNIFVCRYDTSGNLVWKRGDGSTSPVTANCLAPGVRGSSVVSGLFSCSFTDLSNAYGGGVMCSMGSSDVYLAAYDSLGNRLWARQYGSRSNDVVNGMGLYADSLLVTTGSYHSTLFSTASPARYRGYNEISFQSNGPYCNDSDYGQYVSFNPVGSSDSYINGNIDLGRQPLDFFMRSGGGCVRNFPVFCADQSSSSPMTCPDTIDGCGSVNLYAKSLTWGAFGYAPVFHYAWNTGSVTAGTFVIIDGTYGFTMSDSACYGGSDSVYVRMHSNPAQPRISDSKGINVDTFLTQSIHLCGPDSVQLFCTNAGTGIVQWSGYPAGQNPITVSSSGSYAVHFVDTFGCSSGSTAVTVFASNALPPVIPKLACLEDLDGNDSLDLCAGEYFTLLLYDSLSNPSGSAECFPEMDTAYWLAVPDTMLSFASPTLCAPNAVNFIVAPDTGDFDIQFTSFIIRENDCDTDSVFFTLPLHIAVHPLPGNSSLPISITGPTQMCFGDTVMLVSSGGPNHAWSDGTTSDTLYVTQAGFYSATVSDTVTNAWGCQGISTGAAAIFITYFPQPSLAVTPSDGLICPNDSVLLVCSGPSGVFQWQGPAGTPGIDNDSIYVSVPGSYTCVVTVAPGCNLVTNPVQVVQYSTPFIAFAPGNNLCLADTVTLTAAGSLGSSFQWGPPFNDTVQVHTTTTAGTFVCQVTSCGIVTPASVVVYKDTAVAAIQASALSFCQGDSVMLSAGLSASYLWMPGGDTSAAIHVTQGGTYTLTVQSPLGCSDSVQVVITEVLNNLSPPLVQDTQVCAGSPVTLVALSPDTVSWCINSTYSPVLHTGSSLFLTTPASQVYYVYSHNGACRSAFDSLALVVVSVDNAIVADTQVCSGSSVQLVATCADSVFWSTAPDPAQIFHSGSSLLLPNVTAPVTYYVYSRNGACTGAWDTLQVSIAVVSDPVVTDTTVCTGVPVTLHASGPDTIFWSTVQQYGSPFHSGPALSLSSVSNDITYFLYVQNAACRSAIVSMAVDADSSCHTFTVPNIVTPNGDGLNDYFPEPPGDYTFDIRIFNRWGDEIYSRQGSATGWNGKDEKGNKVPDGTYYYILHVVFRDNFSREYYGPVTVLNH